MVDIADMAHAKIQRLNEATYQDSACLSVYMPAMYICLNILGVPSYTEGRSRLCYTDDADLDSQISAMRRSK